MNEREKFKLNRVELRKKRLEQEHNCELFRDGVRDALDPTVSVLATDEDVAMDRLLIYCEEVKKLRGMDKQIAILTAHLDG